MFLEGISNGSLNASLRFQVTAANVGRWYYNNYCLVVEYFVGDAFNARHTQDLLMYDFDSRILDRLFDVGFLIERTLILEVGRR